MKTRKIESGFTEPDMTPMIDIVFQLLTFFMIAINFENTKADERVKLPIDALAKPPESRLENELLLNFGYVRRNGEPVGEPVIFYNGENISLERIQPSLEQEAKFFKAKSVISADKALDDVSVIIRADAGIPTGMVQELIEKCQLAGFTRFSLKASQERK